MKFVVGRIVFKISISRRIQVTCSSWFFNSFTIYKWCHKMELRFVLQYFSYWYCLLTFLYPGPCLLVVSKVTSFSLFVFVVLWVGLSQQWLAMDY